MRSPACQLAAGALLFFFAARYTEAQDASATSPGSDVLGAASSVATLHASSAPAAYPLNEKGTWDLSVWTREAIGNSAYGDIGDDYASMAGFRAGYVFAGPAGGGPLRGTLEYFFDIIPVFVLTKPQVIYGGGVSPVGFQWNFVNSHLHPYLEMSLGGILSTRDVPPGNTSNINFTFSAGGGASIFASARHALTASVGFWHFSNAHIGRNNPSLNALEFGIEYHWFKAK